MNEVEEQVHTNWFHRIPGKKFIHPLPTRPGEMYGFCNFYDIYEEAVRSAPQNSIIVEIGTMAGLSASVMGTLIINSRKNIDFYSIDPLPDLYGDDSMNYYGQEFDVPMYSLFIRNMRSLGLHKYVTQLRMNSVDAAKLFDDDSIHFVFIDGDHTEEAVTNDINAWLPKLRTNGMLAGHDYDHESVKKAVDTTLPHVTERGTSWMIPNVSMQKNWSVL